MTTLLASLLLVGCSSFSLVEYELGGAEESTIAGSPVDAQLAGTELDGLFAANAEDAPDIEEGDLAEASFDSITVEGTDLSFLDAMTISVSAPGLMQEVVAVTDGALEGSGPFELSLMDVDMVPYLESGEMSFSTNVVGVAPTDDTDIRLEWAMTLGVTLQGVTNAADM